MSSVKLEKHSKLETEAGRSFAGIQNRVAAKRVRIHSLKTEFKKTVRNLDLQANK